MTGLPPGWESDYDGTRWFYKYKPTGQVQYHFPSEGDEFPDYVDEASPAPVLAPEEKLESQQQMKRHGSTHTGALANASTLPWQQPAAKGGRLSSTWTGEMSATARPVSFVWDGEERQGGTGSRDDEDDGVFRPETFMFLGPGTYTDVSPLADEEEEAARRVVAGDGTSKGVSPNASTGTTPQVRKSGLETATESPPSTNAKINPERTRPAEPTEPLEATIETPVIHMIDSKELPMELPGSEPWQDPVGRVAEMATGETAVARIETHPDPVEIGDSSAPAASKALVSDTTQSTQPQQSVEKTYLVIPTDQARVDPDVLSNNNNSFVDSRTSRGQHVAASKPAEIAVDQSHSKLVDRENTEVPASRPKYQPYKPGQVVLETQPRRSDEIGVHQGSLQRERSLMMGPTASGGQQLDLSAIPAALHVSKVEPDMPGNASIINDESTQQQAIHPGSKEQIKISMAEEASADGSRSRGVDKFPSVLRPARGRATSQPKADEPPAEDQKHPQIMRPGPGHVRHQSDILPRKPLESQPDLQAKANSQDIQYLPYRSAHDGKAYYDHTTDEDASSPQVATAVPLSMAVMQRAHSVMTRKAVPSKPASRTENQTLPQDQPRFGSTPYGPAIDSPPPRERRHSSFSPSDVSSVASAPSSTALRTPLETPSPLNDMRRASSGVSLVQTVSNRSSFTPSPASVTPGSERHSVGSPLALGSGSNDMPHENTEVGSYFAQGVKASPGLQRSQSMRQSPSPLASPGQSGERSSITRPPPPPGHSLTSIEEHDEMASMHDSVSSKSHSPGISRRHSLASSLDPSPKPTHPLPYNGQPDTHVHNQGYSVAHHRMYPAGVQPQPQPHPGPPVGPFSPRGQQSAPNHSQSHQQHNPPGQSPYRRSMPPGPLAPAPGIVQQPPIHQAPTGWQSQSASQTNAQPQVIQARAAQKDKEKKWTKWFKPTKASSPGPQMTQTSQMPSPGPQSAPWSAQTMGWPQQQVSAASQPSAPHPHAQRPPYQLPHQHGQRPSHSNENRPMQMPYNGPPGVPKQGPPQPHRYPGQVPLPDLRREQYVAHPARQPAMASPGTQLSQGVPTNHSGGAWGPDGGRWG